MKVCVVSLDISFGNWAENIARAEALISQNPGCDMYVLPEFFGTGFLPSFTDVAESAADSKTRAWMEKMAIAANALVCGSVVVKDGYQLRNRFYFVTAEKTAHYDKRHLFSVGGEDKTLSGSDRKVFITYKGFRIQPQICYDLRFPAFSFTHADILIYVANWPVQRQFAWEHLLIARAIENQAFVIGCNRVGTDPGNRYDESSVVLDFMGKAIQTKQNGVMIAELQKEAQRAFRAQFNVQADKDAVTFPDLSPDDVFAL